MALQFRIKPATIAWVHDVLDARGECWLLGCGNVYTNEQAAISKKLFTNPDQEEATYMLHFKKGDKIPATVEEMEDAFHMSKKAESQMRIEQKQGEKPIERKTKWEDEKPVVKQEKKEEPAKEKEEKEEVKTGNSKGKNK